MIYTIVYIVRTLAGWDGHPMDSPAGSQGYEKRIEALQIAVLPKGATIPGTTDNSYKTTGKKVEYRTYVEKQGWKKYSADGEQSGTIGQARAVQGLAVRVNDTQYSGNIVYDTYMQSYGWMGEKANNTAAGILNGGKRMEAIKLHLTGELAEKYDIYYRVHTQTFGCLTGRKTENHPEQKIMQNESRRFRLKWFQREILLREQHL